jgi:hypothetical protein
MTEFISNASARVLCMIWLKRQTPERSRPFIIRQNGVEVAPGFEFEHPIPKMDRAVVLIVFGPRDQRHGDIRVHFGN